MENRSMYDVRPEQYATVIRELIRHENDVTNHRLMWLLIIQGLLVNAYVSVRQDPEAATVLAFTAVMVTLSAFVMLYKSYHARGYLHFLGTQAKLGKLQEEQLRLDGWPTKRIKHWRRNAWVCPWLQRAGDLLEPYLSLPGIIVSAWMFLLLHQWVSLPPAIALGVAVILAVLILSVFCIVWVWWQGTDEEEPTEAPVRL
jgi:hypothetical protein